MQRFIGWPLKKPIKTLIANSKVVSVNFSQEEQVFALAA
jgi:hypothetical protein